MRLRTTRHAGVTLALALAGGAAMGIEEARYAVVRTAPGGFELRDYAPQIVAQTEVNASLEDAGNLAFRRLFGYISGGNRARGKLPMTAPVTQEPPSRKLPMTAPVSQQQAGNGWAVSFLMPGAYATIESLPAPDDPAVTLRPVPARRMAAIRYSGRWSETRYRQHLQRLRDWIAAEGLTPAGDPVWARYNPPFTPWFRRRNEVLIPVESSPAAAGPAAGGPFE